VPQQPDFTANTHKPYRKRLAALVALVEAGDLEGLRAVEMLPPRSPRQRRCIAIAISPSLPWRPKRLEA
jgi:hypothetical protein